MRKLAITGLLLVGCLDTGHDTLEQELETSGLTAEYFRSTTFEANQRVLARIEPSIDATYGWGSPASVVPVDNFGVRWSGAIVPRYSERYTLTIAADDTARVYIDGQLVIDHASAWAPSSTQLALTANRAHAIVVEYAEHWGWAAARLEWQSASQVREVIPTARLVPAPAPPPQPTAGSGGSDYPHGSCVETRRPHWWDDYSSWVYEPAAPRPASAQVVVFNHGWMGNEPQFYARWLDHLCRRGAIVIFPRYQNLLTLPQFFTPNAIVAVKDALAWLATPGHVQPRIADGMVVLGHSAGGTVSMSMAGAAAAQGLPVARAVFPVQPAAPAVVPFTDLPAIPATTRVGCFVGDADTVVGRLGCDAAFAGTPQITGKRYWWQFSDGHGAPRLVADHFQPSEAAGYIDALDTRGAWRIADDMISCAFTGTSCNATTVGQGAWSDGTPVHPLALTIDALPGCPAGSTATGC
ncbi:MAG: PA14 domain-containing protein [Kofleriaceae bacterium]